MDSYSSWLNSFLVRFRLSANLFLSQFEPLALFLAPLLTLFIARLLHSLLSVIHEKGLKATVLALFMSSIK
ncbi:hypothetical protein Godav_019773 [Gossypium davidsonii]|uniref:Uncharacterized protein n=1 Tax=Gossypium davidsonii TaxID=34287 RepID=A0A7J8R0Z8_GOSDV|nr:hypothetical protein [Gossypium davidsonii]